MERSYHFVRRDRDPVMRLLALFLGKSFMTDFWTTYRLPFQHAVTIAYPADVTDPHAHPSVIAHELVHVRQFSRFGAPLVIILLAALFPLPVLFSGRWFIEREAYLRDIEAGRITLEGAVDILWRRYGYAWPRPLMRRWFGARRDRSRRTDTRAPRARRR